MYLLRHGSDECERAKSYLRMKHCQLYCCLLSFSVQSTSDNEKRQQYIQKLQIYHIKSGLSHTGKGSALKCQCHRFGQWLHFRLHWSSERLLKSDRSPQTKARVRELGSKPIVDIALLQTLCLFYSCTAQRNENCRGELLFASSRCQRQGVALESRNV